MFFTHVKAACIMLLIDPCRVPLHKIDDLVLKLHIVSHNHESTKAFANPGLTF